MSSARVAQRIERHRPKVGVGGSSPSAGASRRSWLRPIAGSWPVPLPSGLLARQTFVAEAGMELQIRGRDVVVSDGMRRFIEQRAQKLDHLLEHVLDAKIELKTLTNRSNNEITVAQITVQSGRQILRAEERDRDPHRAVDLAFDKLQRQIRRFKNKRSKRKAPRLEPAVVLDGLAADMLGADGDEEAARLVRTKRFSVKPMDPLEAIEQLELVGHDFYLFLNSDEDQMNVVYRRRDGTYGLLIPHRLS